WLHTCYEPAIVQTYEGFHQDDIHADLPKLPVPALLIVAGRGGVIQPEDEEEIARLQPAIRIARVPNAGHMIPWDDLDGFFAAFGDSLGHPLA
ncbi:MAG: alpha/beta fold hydrolase, partial [Alphaproteobacteria bacterium]